MSNKPKPSTKSGLQSKAELKAKQAALEAQRKRNQSILLTIGALAALVIVILLIALSSRPVEAEVDLAALNKKLDGLTSGITKEGEYPVIFPTLGNPDAAVKMEEISSFACPACKSYHDQVITNLFDKIKSGDLYYVYFPTTRTGDYTEAGKALVTYAGYCAMQQNKFWQMHEVLFDWQGRYGAATPDKSRIQSGAEKLGLDMGKFNTCLDSKEAKDYVDASDKYVSDTRKMASTPSIFLFEKGVQIKPPTQQSNTPDSLNSLSIGEIRGIIEKNSATKPS